MTNGTYVLQKFFSGILLCLTLTACLSSGSLEESGGASADPFDSFLGCVDGSAVDASSILVNFEFPQEYDRITVYRNGSAIYSSSSRASTSFVDTGLQEAATYEYTCEGSKAFKAKTGSNILHLTTMSANAPVFAGITAATALTARSVRVNWSPANPTGPVVSTYQIFANPGATVNWTTTPRSIVASGTFSYTLTNLGDELPYAFGVRACTSFNVCDTNVVERALTLSDGGAPLTTGASSASANNSQVTLNIPWVEANGAVKKRYVYKRVGAIGGTNISDYTLEQTLVVANLANPNTSVSISGVIDNTQYHFIVQDEDPTGNNNNNTNVVSLNTGDTSAPSFVGLSSLTLGAPSDSSLVIGFTAIDREGIESADGTYKYIVYSTSASYPGTPSDPCINGSQIHEVLASGYAPGARTITLTGLSSRTTYAICLKAQDQSGNTSNTTASLSRTTLDSTPPNFDNIQTINYVPLTGTISIAWNASVSSDILEYRIKLWKNTATPLAGNITTVIRSHGTNPSGMSFDGSIFSYTDYDVVYAVVDACDNADQLPGGSKNCTSFALNTAKSVAVPDVNPPAGFTGIKGPADQISSTEGEMTVTWYEPVWSADYQGFKVYSVAPNNSLSLLKNCACVSPGACNLADTTCTVTNLDPYRTYKFHVRAYDAVGNETTYLDPSSSFANKRTLDQTLPAFTSNLVVGAGPTYTLSWLAATDNQYASEPGITISYQVYRKANTTFANATQPFNDGSLRTNAGHSPLNFTDTGLVEGTTYYYSVCALDSSANRRCDGTVRSFVTSDLTVPVIGSFTTNKLDAYKRWNLNWTMSDNTTAMANITVRIFQKISDTESLATTSDSLIYSNVGVTSLTNLSGPTDVNKFISYYLEIEDQAGNTAGANLSVTSNNILVLSSIKRSQGPTAGGDLVVITGTGFSEATKNNFLADTIVSVGGSPCTDVEIHLTTKLTCRVPAGSNGTATVSVQNPEGSISSILGAYLYQSTPTHICDLPGSWGTEMAAGSGTTMNPFIICSVAHLNNMRYKISDGRLYNYLNGLYSFKLGTNIDLDSLTFEPIGGTNIGDAATSFNGSFDGDGHVIANYTYINAAKDYLGLFGAFRNTSGSPNTIKNLGMTNVNLHGRQFVGSILSYYYPIATNGNVIDNLWASGQVTGASSEIGGLIGYINGGISSVSNLYSNVVVTGNNSVTAGVIGRANISGSSVNNVYNYNNVTSVGAYTAGVIGSVDSTLIMNQAYNYGNISSTQDITGGIIGSSNSITLTNAYNYGAISGRNRAGGIIANSGTTNISQAYNLGAISGTNSVIGGIVGSLYVTAAGSMQDVINSGNVSSALSEVGGIIGYLTTATANYTINNVSSNANISSNGSVGGIIGVTAASNTFGFTLTNVHTSGTITLNGGARAGGLIGTMSHGNGTVSKSSSTADVIVSNTASSEVGGLVGLMTLNSATLFKIEKSFYNGTINLTPNNTRAGGLVGFAHHNTGSIPGGVIEIIDSYAHGHIQNGLSSLGGIIGYSQNHDDGIGNTNERTFLTNSFSTVQIDTPNVLANGVVGYIFEEYVYFSNTFWDLDTSTKTIGFSGPVVGAPSGQTTAAMQNQAAGNIYLTAGYDFTPVSGNWKWCSASDYPHLMWETCP